MSTLNGVGFKFYGNRSLTNQEIEKYKVDNNCVIVTEWFVFVDIPIFPLYSYIKISKEKINSYDYGLLYSEKNKYSLIKLPKLKWAQVFLTYLAVFLILVVFVLFIFGLNFVYLNFKILGLIFYFVLIFSLVLIISFKLNTVLAYTKKMVSKWRNKERGGVYKYTILKTAKSSQKT